MSVAVMTTCWKFSEARGNDLLVLLALADIADDDGECWPSMAYIARKARVDVRSARRHIRNLEEMGEIVVVVGGGKASTPGGTRSNRYKIIVHVPVDAEDDSGDVTESDRLPYSGDVTDQGAAPRDGRGAQPGVVGLSTPHIRQLHVSEPSSLAPAPLTPVTHQRDPLFDAVTDVCGIESSELTASARGALNRALKDLRSVGANADEVHDRAAVYRRRWPNVSLTPAALAKHWPQLTQVPTPSPVRSKSMEAIDVALGGSQ